MAEDMGVEGCPQNSAIYGLKKEERNPDQIF